eukprot:gene25476-28795_t
MNDAFDGKILAFKPHDRYEECYEFDVITGEKKSTYIVFWSEEARDKAVEAYIHDSIETLEPEFIQEHLKYKFPIEGIVAIQGTSCANKLFNEMIIDFDSFVSDALSDLGSHGYFLSTYDGEEEDDDCDGEIYAGQEGDHEFDGKSYYYYRINDVNAVDMDVAV